jgi:hypothetical protein
MLGIMSFLSLGSGWPVGQDRGMTTDVLCLPDDPIVGPVLEIVRAEESAPIANHSIRSYLFARLLARRDGLVIGRDVAERALFAACVLHDIGLTTRGNGTQRFEVDGADAAVAILAPLGCTPRPGSRSDAAR